VTLRDIYKMMLVAPPPQNNPTRLARAYWFGRYHYSMKRPSWVYRGTNTDAAWKAGRDTGRVLAYLDKEVA